MRFLRNKQEKIICTLYLIISVAAIVPALFWDINFGLLVLILCIILFLLWFLDTKKRYNRIRELSCDIDRLLHSEKRISLEKYSEGELAILQTEINKMTLRLAEQKQQLQKDKVYMSDSIADISHQIRTPLTSINLLVSAINDSATTPELRGRLVRELSDHLSRIDWLITTLLKISKLDAGTVEFKKEQRELKKLVELSVSPLLIPIELRLQNLNIYTNGVFCGDLSWTAEALTNIVKNCMEHTPVGGSINITAQENPLYSEIIVSDTGSGINAEDMPHIFERFYKGKNSDKNSFGVGLALAKNIVNSQNGTLKAENGIEGGARFTMRFYKSTI